MFFSCDDIDCAQRCADSVFLFRGLDGIMNPSDKRECYSLCLLILSDLRCLIKATDKG